MTHEHWYNPLVDFRLNATLTSKFKEYTLSFINLLGEATTGRKDEETRDGDRLSSTIPGTDRGPREDQ